MGAEETVCTNCHMTQPSPTEMMVLNVVTVVAALGAAIFSVMLIASLSPRLQRKHPSLGCSSS